MDKNFAKAVLTQNVCSPKLLMDMKLSVFMPVQNNIYGLFRKINYRVVLATQYLYVLDEFKTFYRNSNDA